MALIRESQAWEKEKGEDAESVIGTSMTEEDLDRLIAWPHMNICSDGSLAGSHPRGFGAFTRVRARQVREKRVLALEEAVRKMTGLAAAHMGIGDRGLVRPGQHADLVLFDPARVADRATTTTPHLVSEGIESVWVNGVVVYEGGKATGRRPGRVIRRRD
jgi:N-acyl-D-amino-acid deacylase